LDVSRRVIHAEAASLFLVNAETGNLELAIATRGENAYVEPTRTVPRGRGIAGWVFERGEPILIPDAYADERFYKEADRQTGFVTRSIICAPLKRDGQVTGVLQVLNPIGKKEFEPEDLDGFSAYSNLTATAIEKLRALERMRAQERVERDLAIAAEIQREILSRAIPPEVSGACFAAHNTPATNVGGDFYGVFARSPEEIYFAIGDVSGKGISASLLMAQTLSAMQFVFASTAGPADALQRLNETLCANVIRGMFITTLVGRLTPYSRSVELASAGHCPPIVVKADGAAARIEAGSGLPLGIITRATYSQSSLILEKGERLVLYTDGLSESRGGPAGDLFDDFLLECAAGPAGGPKALLDRIVAAERAHRGGGSQLDDLTVLVGGFE
jgi:sigma-B regulation protein RsbU (phosphoserine phosphatase)